MADGWPIADFLTANAVVGSKSEAARLIRGGGLSVNGERISDEKARLRPEDAIHGRYFVVRKGKKDNFLVRVLAVIDNRVERARRIGRLPDGDGPAVVSR